MHFHHRSLRAGALAALLFAVSACAATTAPFDPAVLAETTSLKGDVDAALAQGTEPFAGHEPQVTALETRLRAAADKAAATPLNENAAVQWRIMADPAQGLAGGMFARWRRDGALNAAVVEDGRRQVGEGFDFILCLERNKQSAQTCTPGGN